jgi:hypothetical protein
MPQRLCLLRQREAQEALAKPLQAPVSGFSVQVSGNAQLTVVERDATRNLKPEH